MINSPEATPSDHIKSYAEIVESVRRSSMPLRELHGHGHVAISLWAGRIMGLAFSEDGPNLLWTHPELGHARVEELGDLPGGMGGDRLWFSPELDYHWQGAPDWGGFSNYKVPKAADPGDFDWESVEGDSVSMRATTKLPLSTGDGTVGFEISRTIGMTQPPLPFDHALMKGVDYVGIETSHRLAFTDETASGQIDLWHLLQAPAGSILIVPLRKGHKVNPVAYAAPGDWQVTDDALVWRYSGEAQAKLGLSAAALTGRTAVLRRLEADRWTIIIRDFSVDPAAHYGDHPHGMPLDDQAFQAWDGFGFGEMEYHSPMINAASGPRSLTESDRLWAFGGSAQAIAAIADALLKVDIRNFLAD